MIRLVPFVLTGSMWLSVAVVTEAAVVIQGAILSPDTPVPLMQVGALFTAIGAILYAGKLIGEWNAGQKTLVKSLADIGAKTDRLEREMQEEKGRQNAENARLDKDLTAVKSTVTMLGQRISLPGDEETA